jgi:hypothetical protein
VRLDVHYSTITNELRLKPRTVFITRGFACLVSRFSQTTAQGKPYVPNCMLVVNIRSTAVLSRSWLYASARAWSVACKSQNRVRDICNSPCKQSVYRQSDSTFRCSQKWEWKAE